MDLMERVQGKELLLQLLMQCMLVYCMTIFSLGCSALRRTHWQPPVYSTPDPTILRREFSVRPGSISLAQAEVHYANANNAKNRGDAECVDSFLRAAQYSWQDIEQNANEHYALSSRASEIFRSSLSAIVIEGQKYRRFDARMGLRTYTTSGWQVIPILYHGFPRPGDDFGELTVVGEYTTSQLNHVYYRHGVGVPVVINRTGTNHEAFQRDRQAFAATLMLRSPCDGDSTQSSSPILELHDPLRVSHVAVNECPFPLSSDSTAPIARALSSVRRSYVQSFLQPGIVKPEVDGLFMLEPYQPGKIPVIFIHGLLSDRMTWANMINELCARPEFVHRYQIWAFEYSTGEPFLTSATRLRRQLQQLRAKFDPNEEDTALNEAVLVGHSMGGLISKVQVSESGRRVWSSISNQNFENVTMSSEIRRKFTEAVFFTPSPMISRVVFIGTPHRGSVLAQRAIGKVGSLLIEEPAELKAEHNRLLQENPEAFSDEFTRRFPTSIDLLEPNSPLLQAIDSLPINERVNMHSIIGQGYWMPGYGDSDGVVPVSSAKQNRTTSETMVVGKHAELTENPTVVQQVLRVLREHSEQCAISKNESVSHLE